MLTPLHFKPSARARRGVLSWLPRLAGLALGGLVLCASADNPLDVTLDFARAEHAAGRVTLIDIREPEEHATGVAAGAKLLPMRQLASRLGEVPNAADQPVLLICNTQNRSSATVHALRERGYSNVRFVQGGMSEWARRGWPMVKPGAAAQPGG
jgi:rhodanese-related sulfurtransferase